MKQDDKLYNEWLDEVRNVQPILSNPDELTTAILQQVSRIVPRKKKRKNLKQEHAAGRSRIVVLVGE